MVLHVVIHVHPFSIFVFILLLTEAIHNLTKKLSLCMIINAFFEFLKTAYLFGEENLLGLLLRVYRNMSGWYYAGILLMRVKNPTVFLRQSITNIISVLFCKETIKKPFESRYIKERDGKRLSIGHIFV